jgi:hypothetical protein
MITEAEGERKWMENYIYVRIRRHEGLWSRRQGQEQNKIDSHDICTYHKVHEGEKEKKKIGCRTKEQIEECKTMPGRKEKKQTYNSQNVHKFFNLTIQMSSWQLRENAQIPIGHNKEDWLAMTSPRVGHGRIPASCHGT